MESAPTTYEQVPLKQARDVCADLFEPNPVIYWVDAFGSAAIGWTAFATSVVATPFSATHLIATGVAVFALYRAILFIHELSHLAKGRLPGFNAAWDVVVGCPLALPSFMYHGTHLDHHRKTVYGTPGDPEYVPYGVPPATKLVRALVEPFLAPIALFARFLVLAPLSLVLGGRLRDFVTASASTLAINLAYRREAPKGALRTRWLWTETLAAAMAVGVVVAVIVEFWPVRVLLQWYVTSACIAHVNNIRTLAAHRYRNAGGEMDVQGQLADSVNNPGGWITELWAPVGLRWHGLHHFLPDVPYHNLGKAHLRLMNTLPVNSVYRTTLSSSLGASLLGLWRAARRSVA